MGERIGTDSTFMVDVEFRLDVPQLLTTLCTEETHLKHLKALQIFSAMLDATANRVIEIHDPVLMDLFEKMKVITKTHIDEGEHYNDI